MACKFTVTPDGARVIICYRTPGGPSEMEELKKAMACRKWEKCDRCKSYDVCKRVLDKRKAKEAGNETQD